MTAVATTSPATKPPPGSLCPRSRKNIATMPETGRSNCTITAGSIIGPSGSSACESRGETPVSASCSRCCTGNPMLSIAGRNRRNSAKTVKATIPTTVISPIVSKPRKSTRITLITFEPPASGKRILDEKGRDALPRLTRQHRIAQRSHTGPGNDGQAQIPQPPRLGANPGLQRNDVVIHRLVAPRQPAQPQKQQDKRHHLHDELRQRQVGRRKPDEGHAGGKSRRAGQAQRGKTMILCLGSGADRADRTNQPYQRESGLDRGHRFIARRQSSAG